MHYMNKLKHVVNEVLTATYRRPYSRKLHISAYTIRNIYNILLFGRYQFKVISYLHFPVPPPLRIFSPSYLDGEGE